MKMKFLLTILATVFGILPVFAGITPEESTSPEYLYNHGHSSAVVDIVQINKASVNGETYLTTDEVKNVNDPKIIRWIKNFFIYLDPALDDGSFMRHDVKTSPSYDDL